ncbi:Arm DNA-binding domain-containing protein [Haliea sp. E1-2-M8]|uniref:Arm DNA-binding domain-containing protein n=1 Tax=Haliea sp. E1-2-M8 TaxID=3064706 RepID=UPI00351C1911
MCVQVTELYRKEAGVSGLHMVVTPTSAKCWTLRTMVGERRREIGLGGFPEVPLAEASNKVRELKEQVRQGIDPVERRKAHCTKLAQATARSLRSMRGNCGRAQLDVLPSVLFVASQFPIISAGLDVT